MRAASTLAVLTLGSLGIAAPKLGGIGSGLGALGELGLGILSGQADANDCRTWKTGCAQPSCSLYQIFVGGYCQDTNTPNIVCFRGQMWDSSRRTCVTIPAGQPGSTINPCQAGNSWVDLCNHCGTYGPNDGYCLSDQCPPECNGSCNNQGYCT
ncbi:uncharacterized protein UV8b_05537 [Ustilaginoidea virens]|uniref:Chitin-binding type-2 domain-containing protein n=1 Tax=Ustilaginoidea virens TaxID=1159556 RepID=A0A8E5HTK0_USTVR|nr:uncharacterized protein UV8b_05537 [Ustilaginoidea virens]QUC21294.1 hypothetical protein UV8b_05537 [Ustilaginoidea virens]